MLLVISRKKAWIFLLILVIMGIVGMGMAHSKASDFSWRALLSQLEQCTPFEEVWVTLPAKSDLVFLRYNALQTESGFDLSPYAGKTVLRKTYLYPEGQADWRANLLFDEESLIGGDYMNNRLGGEMLPLSQIPRSTP